MEKIAVGTLDGSSAQQGRMYSGIAAKTKSKTERGNSSALQRNMSKRLGVSLFLEGQTPAGRIPADGGLNGRRGRAIKMSPNDQFLLVPKTSQGPLQFLTVFGKKCKVRVKQKKSK